MVQAPHLERKEETSPVQEAQKAPSRVGPPSSHNPQPAPPQSISSAHTGGSGLLGQPELCSPLAQHPHSSHGAAQVSAATPRAQGRTSWAKPNPLQQPPQHAAAQSWVGGHKGLEEVWWHSNVPVPSTAGNKSLSSSPWGWTPGSPEGLIQPPELHAAHTQKPHSNSHPGSLQLSALWDVWSSCCQAGHPTQPLPVP